MCDAQLGAIEVAPMLLKIALQILLGQMVFQKPLPGQLPDKGTPQVSLVQLAFSTIVGQCVTRCLQTPLQAIELEVDVPLACSLLGALEPLKNQFPIDSWSRAAINSGPRAAGSSDRFPTTSFNSRST